MAVAPRPEVHGSFGTASASGARRSFVVVRKTGVVFGVVTLTVVESAQCSAVGEGGRAAHRVGLDVVDVAQLGGRVAIRVGAAAVANFDGRRRAPRKLR